MADFSLTDVEFIARTGAALGFAASDAEFVARVGSVQQFSASDVEFVARVSPDTARRRHAMIIN